MNFSEEWDKIRNRKVGEYFSTFRRYEKRKMDYYLGRAYKEIPITLKREEIGKARIVAVKVLHSKYITDVIASKDTYVNWTRTEFRNFLRKLYGTSDILLIEITMRWTSVKS